MDANRSPKPLGAGRVPSSRQEQRWGTGTSRRTMSTWAPQPLQSGFPQVLQVVREHIEGTPVGGSTPRDITVAKCVTVSSDAASGLQCRSPVEARC